MTHNNLFIINVFLSGIVIDLSLLDGDMYIGIRQYILFPLLSAYCLHNIVYYLKRFARHDKRPDYVTNLNNEQQYK